MGGSRTSAGPAIGLESLIRLGAIDFVGMDMVEGSPPCDSAEVTSLAAASLMLDCLCLRASDLPNHAVD